MTTLLNESGKPFDVPAVDIAEQQALIAVLDSVPPAGGDTVRSMIRDLTSRAFYGENVQIAARRIGEAIIAITGCSDEEVDDIFQDLISQV